MTTITLNMTSGPIEVQITRSHTTGTVTIQAVRGGSILGTATGEVTPINAALRAKAGTRADGRTHHIGMVLLTPEQAAQVTDAAQATPADEPDLAGQRAQLAAALSDAHGQISAARETATDSEDGPAGYWASGQAARDTEREQAAEEALAAFDAAHPEIREQQAADRHAADDTAALRALGIEVWSIRQTAEYLGVTADSARRQLSRWGIQRASTGTSEAGRITALYPADDIRAAHEARPGRGARTDLDN
jgi:hypothetical protein